MSCKANLLTAIRDYRQEAQHIGSAKQLLEQLSDVERSVERLPDPEPRGSGDIPPEKGETRAEEPQGGSEAPSRVSVEVHQHAGAPQFPDKQRLADLLKRRA